MSLSWHSNLTDILQKEQELPGSSRCIQVGPDGHIISVDIESKNKPKRSKSITMMNSESHKVNNDNITVNNQGFRTPQSLSTYKCKQTIDSNFWRLPRVGFSFLIFL